MNVWAEIGAGGTYNWNDGRHGMFAKLAAQSTIEQFAENYTLSGNIAFKEDCELKAAEMPPFTYRTYLIAQVFHKTP